MLTRSQALAFTLLASLSTTGCTVHVAIEARSHAVVNEEPIAGMVAPYPRLDLRNPGPLLAIDLSSDSDLQAVVTRTDSHHLYYLLFACSSANEATDMQLLSGPVHEGAAVSRPKERNYRVYVPLSYQHLVNKASGIGGLDLDAELEKVRASGLCLRLGGGSMIGTGLDSNAIRVPLSLVGEEFRVVGQARPRTGDTVPNNPMNPPNVRVTRLACASRAPATLAGYRVR